MSSPRVVGNSFDGVRGEQGVEGWFISLDEAQLYVVGNEAWWNNANVKNVISIPSSMTAMPIWMYRNGDMYLGEWNYCRENKRFVEHGVGATYIHNPSKFRGIIYVGGWKKGLFSGAARAFWLESSPTWIRNELGDTGVRQETRDGKLVGRPYSYVGRYVDNVETDERAVVSLKDGTTRIGPWANGKPIGDSWKDYELLSVTPPRSRPTPPDCRTEKRGPTITPTKKRKQSPVMTSRERKNGKFCTASARPCRDSADQQSLQETNERNHEMSVQQAEMAASEEEDAEKVIETDHRARSCRDSAGQQSLQEATDRETHERNKETSIQHVETTASKEEDGKKVIETYQGARPSRDSADQQTTEHNQEMLIQQVESTALKEEDEENGVETDQDREEEITMWLITVIGYNPSTKLMREYAKQFMNLGLHSSQMISDLLPANRVSTFEWMKEFHRVQFLSNANLKIYEGTVDSNYSVSL